jgi:hypothetical protein
MWLQVQGALPLLICLAAAVCFGVVLFIVGHAKLRP